MWPHVLVQWSWNKNKFTTARLPQACLHSVACISAQPASCHAQHPSGSDGAGWSRLTGLRAGHAAICRRCWTSGPAACSGSWTTGERLPTARASRWDLPPPPPPPPPPAAGALRPMTRRRGVVACVSLWTVLDSSAGQAVTCHALRGVTRVPRRSQGLIRGVLPMDMFIVLRRERF